MEIQDYLNLKQELQNHLLRYIESGKETKGDDLKLINFLEMQKFREIQMVKEDTQELLYLIAKIANNHHRNSTFFTKIEQILLHFEKDIKQSFSNSEIYNVFRINKRVLLFLIQKEIIKIDESIANLILKKSDTSYRLYLFPEIKDFLNNDDRNSIEKELNTSLSENFDEKRKIGENDTILCQLIRKDNVEDFISHVNNNNISLTSRIKPSLFETNSFLLKKEPTLFEYAAFCGSVKIFQCLITNNIELTSSLWLYSIHGENAELIRLLEENGIIPENASYSKCLEEAIKCHHIEIANHIKEKYIKKEEIDHDKFNSNSLSYAFHFFNYAYIKINKFSFYYACQYNYVKLVQLFLRAKEIDINEPIVLNQFVFIYQVFNYFLNSYHSINSIFLNGIPHQFQHNFFNFLNEIPSKFLNKIFNSNLISLHFILLHKRITSKSSIFCSHSQETSSIRECSKNADE